MRSDEMIAVALVGVALYLLFGKGGKAKPAGASMFSVEVTPSGLQPGDNGFGWRYFTDGVSIDPQGNYYLGGKLTWVNPLGLAA